VAPPLAPGKLLFPSLHFNSRVMYPTGHWLGPVTGWAGLGRAEPSPCELSWAQPPKNRKNKKNKKIKKVEKIKNVYA